MRATRADARGIDVPHPRRTLRWRHVRVLAVSAALAAGACARSQPASPRPDAVGLSLTWSAADCDDTTADADHDQLNDACELDLARAFAPDLIVDARDCLWKATVTPARLGGAYLFAVQRTPAGARIAYLPAYYRDCGWSGPVCVLRGPGCGAHTGDSEFIVVDVVSDTRVRDAPMPATAAKPAPEPLDALSEREQEPVGNAASEATRARPPGGRWRTTGVFLSAHCFGRSDGRCRWYRGQSLDRFAWADDAPSGAPRVWVARGKHAFYPSTSACDAGHWYYDSCDGNRSAYRFPIHSNHQNAGSRAFPLDGAMGCVTREQLPLGPDGTVPGTRECLWDASQPFRGWQGATSGGAESYARYLVQVAGF